MVDHATAHEAGPRDAPRRRPARTAPRAGRRRAAPSGGDPDLEALRTAAAGGASPSTTRRPTSSRSTAAFDLAVEAHEGQRRATGEPYVTHPIAVGPDPRRARASTRSPIQAALLHDVPEDTEYSLTDIEERFGAGGRPARRRRHQAVASSAPTATSSSRPRTSARCSWRWPRTSGSSSSSSPTGSTTCARCTACRPRSSSASPARRWRSTRRWPSGSGSGR